MNDERKKLIAKLRRQSPEYKEKRREYREKNKDRISFVNRVYYATHKEKWKK